MYGCDVEVRKGFSAVGVEVIGDEGMRWRCVSVRGDVVGRRDALGGEEDRSGGIAGETLLGSEFSSGN